MLINSELQESHPDWVPYVVMKLYANKNIDPGKDESGRAKHWISLEKTIRVAGKHMNESGLREFLEELRRHETSRYFELDKEVSDFLDRGEGDYKRAKREYLEKHHANFWVRQGRLEEELAAKGIGFNLHRNHAEAIARTIPDLDSEKLYAFSNFLSNLSSVEENTPVLIEPPFNEFAYCMTRDANGLVDLVRFHDHSNLEGGQDIITKIPGKRRTWNALAKRVSFKMHKAEEDIRKAIKEDKEKLDNLLIEAGERNDQLQTDISDTKALIKSGGLLGDAGSILARISEDYKKYVDRFNQTTGDIANNIANLEELSKEFIAQI